MHISQMASHSLIWRCEPIVTTLIDSFHFRSLILLSHQTRCAGVVRPCQRHLVNKEHPLRVADECLDLQTAQTAEGVREVDLLHLAVPSAARDARTWWNGSVLGVCRYLVFRARAVGISGEDHGADICAVVVTAEEGAVSVEPKHR